MRTPKPQPPHNSVEPLWHDDSRLPDLHNTFNASNRRDPKPDICSCTIAGGACNDMRLKPHNRKVKQQAAAEQCGALSWEGALRAPLGAGRALQVQHGEVVLRERVAHLGRERPEVERLLRVRPRAPATQVHQAQVEPGLHVALRGRAGCPGLVTSGNSGC